MLIDRYNRRIDYLRISVTDRCNLRCIYCMPECGIIHKPHKELLSFEEIIEIVAVMAELGIDKIRLTGGEPLVRKDLVNLINSLSKIKRIKDISMTTNGILLKRYAKELKQAGLMRLNISLDSLRQDRYKIITRQGRLEDVLEGIRGSFKVGFSPIKINILLLEDIDECEISQFLRLTNENPINLRFLEFMPVNSFYKSEKLFSSQMVMDIARRFQEVEETSVYGNGPAKVYKFKNALGTFGIISPMSHKFCDTCNRLRLTSDGLLRLCLHSDLKVNLREPLRRGLSQEEIIRLIKLAVEIKPKQHFLDKETILKSQEFSMCQIGG
ncbi:MAG: GTP 3',8-cyclase MoaA [Candidatus Omnitrophota bacterium]|nr:GTP 3',8-cyclase MoaA [Candidatus Omnitrophota bacterium]